MVICMMATIIIMVMTMDEDALYRLMTWLSPAYPIGAFSHSSGLEWAVEADWVCDRASAHSWLETLLSHGASWNDAVLFKYAHRAAMTGDAGRLCRIASLGAAAHPAAERRLEQMSQGAAFRRAAIASGTAPNLLRALDGELVYPVAVAVMTGGCATPLGPALTAFLHAGMANLVSAAQRLVPLGQTDAQIIVTVLQPSVAATVRRAMALDDDDDPFDSLSSATLCADVAAMLHETQYTRLFRT